MTCKGNNILVCLCTQCSLLVRFEIMHVYWCAFVKLVVYTKKNQKCEFNKGQTFIYYLASVAAQLKSNFRRSPF